VDASLRALERRWREGGALEDGAAWVAARLRAGSLDRHLVAFAAALGDEVARRALGTPAPAGGGDLVAALGRAGPRRGEAAVRAAVAAARACEHRTDTPGPDEPGPSHALLAAQAWLLEPTDERRRAAWTTARACRLGALVRATRRGSALDGEAAARADHVAVAAAAAAAAAGEDARARWAVRALAAAAQVEGPDVVRRVVDELVAWALA
jgi:hypothetical protein